MATIAKGSITLVNVDDAYSVLATPSTCAIKADFDGSNPVLDEAFCDISVVRDGIQVPFEITAHRFSNDSITCSFSGTSTLQRMTITSIPSNILSGSIEMDLKTEDSFVATVRFQYSVIREATMLDWIKDWENNKTKIGNTYMITPKIFVGKRENATEENLLGELTGVYIGPSDVLDDTGANIPGIYGYKSGNKIFYINGDTAKIAQWSFDENALWLGTKWSQENDFVDSDSITLGNSGIIGPKWRLMADGSGKVAGGNISWTSSGELTIMLGDESLADTLDGIKSSASSFSVTIQNDIVKLEGRINTNEKNIQSNTGLIAGLDDAVKTNTTNIGTIEATANNLKTEFATFKDDTVEHFTTIEQTSTNIQTNVTNLKGDIATANTNITQNADSITAIVKGLTNTGINIEDGTLTLHAADNKWQLNSSGDSYISGWLIKTDRLATDKVAIVSEEGVAGMYMTANDDANFTGRDSTALEDYIDSYGGIYMQVKAATDTKAASANMAAYNSNGTRVFKLKSNGENYIAGWTFDAATLYTGTEVDTKGSYTNNGEITIGPNGIRGYKWRLESDGSGAVAGGKIAWNADGSGSIAGDNIKWDSTGAVTFSSSVSLSWTKGIGEAKSAASTAQTTANNAKTAASTADTLAVVSRQMTWSKMLYRDPEFANGYNKTSLYPQWLYDASKTGYSRSLETDDTAPNSTHIVMKISSDGPANDTDHRLMGWSYAVQTRANAKFVCRFIAKLPTTVSLRWGSNSIGTGGNVKWLTSAAGTGTYTEYVVLVNCGYEGDFNTTIFFALSTSYSVYSAVTPENPMVWYVAYATVYDLTATDKSLTTIDANGIYTGTLSADQITAGTIDATKIKATSILSNGTAWALNKDGSGYLANGNITWNADGSTVKFTGAIETKSGSIGGVEISKDHIGMSNEDGGGSLSIYEHYFRVGYSDSYVTFGRTYSSYLSEDTITITGNVRNSTVSSEDKTTTGNFGLNIDVSGGKRNWGVYSNAPLMTPAFITTKAKAVDFSSLDGEEFNFSQHNVILMYNGDSTKTIEASLPQESDVASMFLQANLPNDFATVVIFCVRKDSYTIKLKDIWDLNGTKTDYTLEKGDSLMVLVTSIGEFHYQVLSHSH